MTLTIKLFGPQAQLAGKREVTLNLPNTTTTIQQLRQALQTAEPALAHSLPASRLAVNCTFADDSHIVNPNDELALIGLVSGG